MSAKLVNGRRRNKTVGSNVRKIAIGTGKLVVPALAVLGVGAPAGALELGPVRMESTLGQPLRASIAFALRPDEQIAAHCVSVATARSGSGLPSPGPTWVSVHDGAIHLVSEHPVADPLVGLELTVDCPYAAHLSRQYVVFIDPPRTAAPAAPERRVARETPADADGVAEPPASPARAAPPPQAAIASATSYRVSAGDTLSGIAERLPGRRLGLWSTVDRLFAANPQAFIDGDANRLRAGAVLRIPNDVYSDASAPVTLPDRRARARAGNTAAPAAVPGHGTPALADAARADAPATTGYGGYAAPRTTDARPAASAVAPDERADALFVDELPTVPVAAGETDVLPAAAVPAVEADARPQPGDVLVDPEGLFVTPVDGGMAAPQPTARQPAEPTAEPATHAAPLVHADTGKAGGAWSWLIGLGGSGVVLILGLLLFGRRRQHAGRPLVFDLPEQDAGQRAPDADGGDDAAEMRVDFRFDEAEADARIVRVDADLDDGRGFQESGDLVVAQDFGFADSGSLELGLDIDFSEEALAAPGRAREGEVIVEKEIPPGDPTTSEYDLSMIVDATRQPIGDADDTEKDLHAIQLEGADGEAAEDPFTMSNEVDYKILEQDYEDELTATQALALELSSAARHLVDELYEPGETGLHELPTVEMPAPDTEPTAKMPAPRTEATAEMPVPVTQPTAGTAARGGDEAAEPAGALDGDDPTELLPPAALADGDDTSVDEALALVPEAGNDAAIDLDIESATVDTKKLKAS